ncbi:tRNA(adenine34) deaminase [Ruminiclostridium sufflavum DSM 19573]|uniref:tRNA-specific adenosine deaminase n=1 Tax=Ruminiclostridium sufflavum DSM 19573 TaxID=1121337 RepID=A0A318XGU2_9FIRM|nr:tRNA adenosine(34) deaminase TadA [Ruminiclostridium sufflavum]PYG85750.1 tRNA(adenine34) deaminase [Ruminiclostridium sufflavum DSM 19573]
MYTRKEQLMIKALNQAKLAYKKGETPVGAIIVRDGQIISRGHNLKETKKDVTSHAEIEAIRRAARKLGTWRLDGCEMYVTLEPCPMCAGAIIQSRISTLYIGAMDNRAGAAGSAIDLFRIGQFNHRVDVVIGLLFEECGELLKDFFRNARRDADKGYK